MPPVINSLRTGFPHITVTVYNVNAIDPQLHLPFILFLSLILQPTMTEIIKDVEASMNNGDALTSLQALMSALMLSDRGTSALQLLWMLFTSLCRHFSPF